MLNLSQLKTKINEETYLITKSKNTQDIPVIAKYIDDLEEEKIIPSILKQIIKYWKGTNVEVLI
jgi:hypothetical protein